MFFFFLYLYVNRVCFVCCSPTVDVRFMVYDFVFVLFVYCHLLLFLLFLLFLLCLLYLPTFLSVYIFILLLVLVFVYMAVAYILYYFLMKYLTMAEYPQPKSWAAPFGGGVRPVRPGGPMCALSPSVPSPPHSAQPEVRDSSSCSHHVIHSTNLCLLHPIGATGRTPLFSVIHFCITV